ncbi:DUF5131 family protein (plasmid) [Burkholderia aenigmatica]|uniref:DUF5131 family protein n=1 Tax=Burkholderia aenigmatica TaxID=2015348 RepID=UPI003B43124E
MGEKSGISWSALTWSPWEGCQRVGPGCDHCYAESMNRWLRRGANWGPGAQRRTYGDAHWRKPMRWDAAAQHARRRVQVFPSVCDPFDNASPAGERMRFAQLILDTPNLIWLLLTKRIGNAASMLAEMFPDGTPDNVWVGATIVDRTELLRDASKLKALNVSLRFWSVEPMLGDLGEFAPELLPEWVIAGGESGRHARPMHPMWVKSLRDQCVSAGVPFMFKQWGMWAPWTHVTPRKGSVATVRWYEDGWRYGRENLAVVDRQVDDESTLYRIGTQEAGRLLDGELHDAFPFELA